MANEEQLAIPMQGVGFWNKWRSENREARSDLSEADLHKAHLSGADLIGTTLIGALSR